MKRCVVAAAVLFALACSKPPIVVGSKNFTESVILGELLAQTLESQRCTVDRRLNMGGTLVCDSAIASGSLDASVDYSGPALPRRPPPEQGRHALLRFGDRLGLPRRLRRLLRHRAGGDPEAIAESQT